MALWGGRFQGDTAKEMVAFSESMAIDMMMWKQDIEGSRAHAKGLLKAGLLSQDELDAIDKGLDQVGQELADGSYRPGPEHEDIHMAVEARLTEIIGDAGAKLHTARSRNDQVATDVRLWMRTHLIELEQTLVGLVASLTEKAALDGQALMPGYTHLQRGQPILLGHQLLAHAWPFARDVGRVRDLLARLDQSPLGAGAMAGTPHPIDRPYTASLLGFSEPVPNAMDAVAARDHQMEAASVCAIAMIHMSRLAEELVLWSGSEFRFIRMNEAWTTGSSIMPQKRNPDAAELVRGKSGRVVGSLNALMVMCKGLPMAYNRDLQEDREQLFDSILTTTRCASITAQMIATMTVFADRFEQQMQGDFLLATELADFLATKGVPFRDAHHVAGRVVADCEARDTDFSGLTVAQLQTFHEAFDDTVLSWLSPRQAAERRRSLGGTSSEQIELQVQRLRAWALGR